MTRKLRVAFTTLGCKVNQYDTATMQTALAADCETVPFAEGADVYVVNSCTVTDRADAESRQLARRARRLNPAGRVILTGCFAQTSPQRADLPEVDYVVGVGRLPDLLRAVRDQIPAEEGRVFVSNLRRAESVSTLGAEVFSGQTRAFLKVQEGCDLFCTFCIVPMARGRGRSVPPRRVLAELERLADLGFREVVLTGIHLGGYGKDLETPLLLADLVEMIAEAAPLPRIRLSSIDPPEVTPRLLDLIARSPVLCDHLHMPVQAGADGVLRRMRRLYDAALVRDVAAEIHRRLPGAGLGTDVIAGFPGESEADFAATEALLAEAGFTYLHVFPYSRRRGTTAAKASDHLPPAVIRARAAALRRLGRAQREGFAERCLGRELEVLIESTRDAASGRLVGYSRNYARVLVDGPDGLGNRALRVRAVAREGDRLHGERVGDADAAAAG
ncbi:MAG TPA: tRNA (N(6)-L-threonylcarbamoyladenosine(37)-C(2))-methylthiotransferase MtaB [Candidatus Dormibacteraeota bacterium]|nr:tRNA (N(6)-L-threonylcarbamoyladenosine(37)-C(2))-methylthiotransferase MtaB [Candidatus Dormibacteraeota bacterium]